MFLIKSLLHIHVIKLHYKSKFSTRYSLLYNTPLSLAISFHLQIVSHYKSLYPFHCDWIPLLCVWTRRCLITTTTNIMSTGTTRGMISLILLLLTHLPLHMKINELEIQLTKLLDNLFWISNQMEKPFNGGHPSMGYSWYLIIVMESFTYGLILAYDD